MGIYRSTIIGDQDGQTVEVIMGWRTNTTAGSANALVLATSVYTSWSSHICPLLVDDYEMTSVVVVGMDDPTVMAEYDIGTPTPGARGEDPLPMFVVANVHLATGLRGRSYQGRFGIPGLSVARLDTANGNLLDPTHQGLIQTAVSDFIGDVDGTFGTQSELAVVSTISGGTPRPTPLATPVTTATVRQALGSRVSRKG